ncbi:MAG TPA: hypothetical protein PKD79_01520, partial [Candidatus Doudnabacteria bacterium]|nr:hypothetical protein [Candidatus Doudnabacteria bacterium]
GATPGGVYSTPDGTVWFVTSDMQKRPFTSAGAFLSYGFLNFSQVVPADASVTALPTGSFIAPADGKIFCATETKGSDVAGECALITGSQKASFTSAAVFAAQGHSFDRAMYGDSSFLSKTSNIDNGSAAHLPGVLINNSGTVQMVVSGGLWGIPSIEVFNSWGYSFADVVPANAADLVKAQIGVIPGRTAGQLVPTGVAGPVTPGPGGTFNPNGGTQGSIESITLGSRDKTEANEGESNVEIYANDIKLNNDGPLMVQSFDVWFAEDRTVATDSRRPWDYFTQVALKFDGNTVATMNTSSASAWSNATNGNIGAANTDFEYRLRFNNLSGVLSNNTTTKVSVAVTMVNNLDSADATAIWWTETGNFRILDESGFSTEQTNAGLVAGGIVASATALEQSFNIGQADAASLEVRTAADKVDAAIIQVSKTSDTNGVTVFHFDLEEKNDVNANITKFQVTFTTTGTTTENTVIKKAYLYDGNTKLAEKNVPDGGVVLFDNMNLNINGDSKKTLTVKVDLFDNNSGARYIEGTTLAVVANTTNLEATDSNGNDEDDMTLAGTSTSNTHELRSEGIMVEMVGNPSASVTTVDGATNDIAQFTWTFDVTAFGSKDVYINRVPADIVLAAGKSGTDVDVEYLLEYSGATPTALAAQNGTIVTSSGSNVTAVTGSTGYTGDPYNGEALFRIAAGTTGRFTVTVSGTNAGEAKQVRGLLNDIEWTVDSVLGGGTGTHTINAYTFNLGNKAATPFVTLN